MTVVNDEKTLLEVQRLTALARVTDDGASRANYYRLAQRLRDRCDAGKGVVRYAW